MHHSVKPVCHDKTHVLLLSWEAACDDLKTEDEVNELASVFKDIYKFEVKRGILKEQRPQKQVNFHLAGFVNEHDKEHALLIIYYAGHGWSDGQELRLTPKTSHSPGDEPHDRDSIAWGSAEINLRSTDADILVIFDCCDAGALWRQNRSPRRCFEFLGACEENQNTRKPGPQSFTSALIWALKELRTRQTFQSSELRNKIEEAPNFPDEQHPPLFSRFAPSPEHIWIAPHNCTDNQVLEPPNGEYRDAGNEYLDLRFHFHHHLNESDIIATAKALSRLMNDTEYDMSARRISLKRKYSLKQEIESIAHEWKQHAKKRRRASGGSSVLVPSPPNGRKKSGPSGQQSTPRIIEPDPNEKNLDSSTLVAAPMNVTTTCTMVMYQEQQTPYREPLSGSEAIHPAMKSVIESDSAHTSDITARNDGVAYHFWMLLSRTTEKGQAALEWVRDKITPSTIVSLQPIRT